MSLMPPSGSWSPGRRSHPDVAPRPAGARRRRGRARSRPRPASGARHHLPHRVDVEAHHRGGRAHALEEGRFALDEPIKRWAPEFAAMRVLRSPTGTLHDAEPAARPITFGDLLTHIVRPRTSPALDLRVGRPGSLVHRRRLPRLRAPVHRRRRRGRRASTEARDVPLGGVGVTAAASLESMSCAALARPKHQRGRGGSQAKLLASSVLPWPR
jgi:hypothetical protein